MKQFKSHIAILLICLLAACNVHAATITYSVRAPGLQSYWQIDYVLTNHDGPLFNEFTIYSDLQSIIVNFSPPSGWAEWGIIMPNYDLSLPGFMFAISQQPVLIGDSLTFSAVVVSPNPPASQFFELGIANPFFIVQSGFTTAVPELNPAHGLSIGLSLMGVLLTLRKKAALRRAGTGVN